MKRQYASSHLAQKVRQALKDLARFLGYLVLGAIWAVAVVLPWAIKMTSVAVWAWGVLVALNAVYRVYESAPGWAEHVLLALPVLGFVAGGYLAWKVSDARRWGVLTATGLGLWAGARGLEWAWQAAPEAVALAPAVLYLFGSVYTVARLRSLRRTVPPQSHPKEAQP